MGAYYSRYSDDVDRRPPKKPTVAGSGLLVVTLVLIFFMLLMPWYTIRAKLPATEFTPATSLYERYSLFWVSFGSPSMSAKCAWSELHGIDTFRMVFTVTLMLVFMGLILAIAGLALSGKRPGASVGFAICVAVILFISPLWMAFMIPWASQEDCFASTDQSTDGLDAPLECEGVPFLETREAGGVKTYFGPTWSWVMSWIAGCVTLVAIPLLHSRNQQMRSNEEREQRRLYSPRPSPYGPMTMGPYGRRGLPGGPYGHPCAPPPRHPYRDPYGPGGPPAGGRYGGPYGDPYGPPHPGRQYVDYHGQGSPPPQDPYAQGSPPPQDPYAQGGPPPQDPKAPGGPPPVGPRAAGVTAPVGPPGPGGPPPGSPGPMAPPTGPHPEEGIPPRGPRPGGPPARGPQG